MAPIDLSLAPSTWIATLSAIAAVASATFAMRNSIIARRALALSARAAELANANFNLYLIDTFRYRLRETGAVLHVFSVSIESKSSLQNAVADVELRIPFVKQGVERIAVFRHSKGAASSMPFKLNNLLDIPFAIPARGAVIGNFCFEVPQGVLEKSEFGPFHLRIRYSDGPPSELQPKIIMDVMDAENLEKKRKTGVPI